MSELPNGWKTAEIGDLCNLINGRAFKPQEWGETGLPIIRIQNLNNQKSKFNYFSGDLDSKHLISNGDLLFAWSGTPGTSFGAHIWHGPDAALNQHIFKIEFSEECIARNFLRYAIDQKLDELIGSAQGGVGLRHVTKGTFEKTAIAFPPRAEQTRIAQKLDELLAQVDTLKARIDAIPALLKRFRQSVLAAAVSGRLTEEWRVSSMRAEAKNGLHSPEQTAVPASWFSFIHDEIADVIDPHPSHRTPSEDLNGIPYIGIGDINKFGLIEFENARKVSRSVLDEHRDRYSINDGDFIFGKIGTIGSATKVPAGGEYTISANVILVKPIREKVVPSYHFLFWCSPLALEISAKGSKATSQAAFGIKKMRKTELLYPPLDEQTEIVHRVEQLFAFADQLEAKVASAKSRIDHLTQSILAKAFRGELVPQDPNDEPASVLLERIKTQRAAAPKAKRGRKSA